MHWWHSYFHLARALHFQRTENRLKLPLYGSCMGSITHVSHFLKRRNRLKLRLYQAHRTLTMPVPNGTFKRVDRRKLVSKVHKNTLTTLLCIGMSITYPLSSNKHDCCRVLVSNV